MSQISRNCPLLILVVFVFLWSSSSNAWSAKPLSERQSSEMIIGTASSEGLAKAVREKQCVEALADEKIISLYFGKGWSAGDLAGKAATARDLDDSRRARVLKLIVEAYGYDGGPQAWFENAWAVCMDGA